MNHADAMEIAIIMAKLKYPRNDSARKNAQYYLYKSIIGEAEYPMEDFAEMVLWDLENSRRPMSAKRYEQFKIAQNALVEWGIVPGPREEVYHA